MTTACFCTLLWDKPYCRNARNDSDVWLEVCSDYHRVKYGALSSPVNVRALDIVRNEFCSSYLGLTDEVIVLLNIIMREISIRNCICNVSDHTKWCPRWDNLSYCKDQCYLLCEYRVLQTGNFFPRFYLSVSLISEGLLAERFQN